MADINAMDDFRVNSPILCFVYKNCATDAMASISNLNNRAAMPGIAASTSSRVDSAAKHIMACKVNSDLMLNFVSDSFENPQMKRRELHINKDKYCVFKNDLVLNVNIPLFPDKSQVAGNGTRAYPSVVSTLGDCNWKVKEFLISLYNSHDNQAFEKILQNAENEPEVFEESPILRHMPYFTAEGYALGTAWASDQTGDTVSSVLIGGMQTVMNGAFACQAGEVLQWYFEFEEAMFYHSTQKSIDGIKVRAGARIEDILEKVTSHPHDPKDPLHELETQRKKNEKEGIHHDVDTHRKRRRDYMEKMNGIGRDHKGNKAFPKPYRLYQYDDHFGDKIRIFAKCISSARPHEMVDIMLMTQSL